ncbi:ImmA/IrrE family metallo-endopeptidase [Bifidobacterium pseudolongum]|uniref:ImmA/IrrE family metallo-endopeptidase n=1 Tax=Bifidobacterium pseudolongum TaxID=1694 RepID=A0A395XFR7_9BIFI|nr:ImmA/IrrE family metallo-endopeptidase [Bifidobacterium pseudolongum]RGW08687.1 ImmA/IrrE family metallo-endopeptidase [Bifidobacterium pseudolongum]
MPASNNYDPQRLTLALEFKGWTQKELASRLELRPSYVSMLVHGRAELTDRLVERIGFIAGLPVSFFTKPAPLVDVGSLTFRKRANARNIGALTSEWALLTDAIAHLRRTCPISDCAPWLDSLAPSARVDADMVERIALDTRRSWGLADDEPIRNLCGNLDRQGIIVAATVNQLEKGDGLSCPARLWNQPVVGLCAAGKPGDRMRFTLAHELGHLILHRDREPERVEDEANRFAGALLFPRTAAAQELHADMTLNDFAHVKARWGVSVAALTRRALDLDVIDGDRYRSLQIQLSNRGWRTREPVEVEPEDASLLAQMAAWSFGEALSPDYLTVRADMVEDTLGVPFTTINQWCWNRLHESIGTTA